MAMFPGLHLVLSLGFAAALCQYGRPEEAGLEQQLRAAQAAANKALVAEGAATHELWRQRSAEYQASLVQQFAWNGVAAKSKQAR